MARQPQVVKTHWWNGQGVVKVACGAKTLLINVHIPPLYVTCKSCLNHALKFAEKRTDEATKALAVAEKNESNIRLRIRDIANEVVL